MRTRIVKITLKMKKTRGLSLSDFQTCYKATVIKTMWYQHKDRHMHQWNRNENLEINPYIYGQLSFGKGVKTIYGV